MPHFAILIGELIYNIVADTDIQFLLCVHAWLACIKQYPHLKLCSAHMVLFFRESTHKHISCVPLCFFCLGCVSVLNMRPPSLMSLYYPMKGCVWVRREVRIRADSVLWPWACNGSELHIWAGRGHNVRVIFMLDCRYILRLCNQRLGKSSCWKDLKST